MVIFLHGIGTRARMWDEHIKLLPEFYCIAPDLPGHGQAAGRPWVSVAATAAEIAAMIEATPGKRAHVVGLSLGGAVAIELMNTRPELLDRVLIDGVSAVPWRLTPLLLGVVALVSPLIHTRLVRNLLARALSIGEPMRKGFYAELEMVNGRTIRRAIHDALGVRLAKPPRVRGPVLLVAGQRDVGAARASNATLARELPNASAWYLPRAWHAWAGTNPNRHRAMVRAFLLDQPLPKGLRKEKAKPRKQGT
jgi:pimeloyl-ACP methyl ester carboxylesterase